jgi:acyl-CoA dehydrogenase
MVSGDIVGAIAMTEPGAGSDLQGVTTRAKLNSNGDYILNGSKVLLPLFPFRFIPS